jgi:hypothetical protein
MVGKRCIRNFCFVVIALSSASCFCQQAQIADQDSAQVAALAVATHQDTISEAALAFSSGEASPIAIDPELNGTLVPANQISKGATPPHFGRQNDVAIFPFANFNPITPITIRNTPHLAISSNKSSVGGSAEYRHWFSGHNAVGVLYTQNPSDGKLLWQG